MDDFFQYDVMVVGGGEAALAAAIASREEGASVALITKGKAGFGGSSVISDGVHSAIFTPEDSPETFFEDMVVGSRYLTDQNLAKILANECTVRVNELESKYKIHVEREKKVATPGHSYQRRVYAGNGVGRNITEKMRAYAQEIGVEFHEFSTMVDLLKENGRVIGAIVNKNGQLYPCFSSAVILATGGFGGLYTSSDNPRDVTGEGIGMAWRHGADLVDMEFVQFYPYRLSSPANVDVMTKIFGKGAFLVNDKGERFMEKYPRKELETRDVLSYEMFKQNQVFLDFSCIQERELEKDSPHLYRLYKKGYEGKWVMYPVQHFCMGGIQIDEWGRTNLPGMYACGECAGGLHGANRLGGGALTEALVFGTRAGKMAAKEKTLNRRNLNSVREQMENFNGIDFSKDFEQEIIRRVKEIMWEKVGIERSLSSLEEASKEFEKMISDLENHKGLSAVQLQDKIRTAWAVTQAGALRKESRGAHKLQDIKEEKKEYELKITLRGKGIEYRKPYHA